MRGGELAKSRQRTDLVTEPEARQPQPLASPTLQAHAGVQMPGQHIAIGLCIRVVAQRPRAHTQGLVNHLETECCRRVCSMIIVVAAHQGQVQVAVAITPLREGCLRRGRMGVR